MSDAFPSDPYPGIAVPPPFGTPFEVRKALEAMRADAVARHIARTTDSDLRARRRAFRRGLGGGLGGGLLAGLLLGVGGCGAAWWLQQAAPRPELPAAALTSAAPAPAASPASDAGTVVLAALAAPAPDASAAPPGSVVNSAPGGGPAADPVRSVAPAGLPPVEVGKPAPERRGSAVRAEARHPAGRGRRAAPSAPVHGAARAAAGPARPGSGRPFSQGGLPSSTGDVAYAATGMAFELRDHAPLLGE